ncbi:MAG TPA: HAD-IIB family hydrolase [Polyangia bacterium]|jgi:HAD superfamily hydrolase (TIGR01484 family)|nr:HAD-IIB family hydrolase [Polyangia bacterium]
MRYHALACDYDGTLAVHGRLLPATADALGRLRETGRKLVMVTGRQVDDLVVVCPDLTMFDSVVAENGAVIYRPKTREVRLLAEAPPRAFAEALAARGVEPVGVGHVIVATWHPHETVVLEEIRRLGLELQVIFNKGAVMVLPSGTNKATGLAAALHELGLSAHNTVGVGDAENDHAFLSLCECGVAVANALPTLKERADLVTVGDHGEGVIELVDAMITSDLSQVAPRLGRHDIPVGSDSAGRELTLPAYGASVLIAGTSGSGKSTLAAGILERLSDKGYQYCIIDPEGDYSDYDGAVVLGDSSHAPGAAEVVQLVETGQNAVANILALGMEQRPPFFEMLFPRLQEVRARTARPHWILVDETHHLLPSSWDASSLALPQERHGLMLITVHPEHVSATVLNSVDAIFVIGQSPAETLKAFAHALGEPPPPISADPLEPGEVLVWWLRPRRAPVRVHSIPSRGERRRHVRKYAEGQLGPDKSFYFKGREGKLNLRAQNLTVFLQVADGVDDDTWLHHLREGDYSQWLRESIKDSALADVVSDIEQAARPSPKETRAKIRAAIEERYTAPS